MALSGASVNPYTLEQNLKKKKTENKPIIDYIQLVLIVIRNAITNCFYLSMIKNV